MVRLVARTVGTTTVTTTIVPMPPTGGDVAPAASRPAHGSLGQRCLLRRRTRTERSDVPVPGREALQ